MSTDAPYGAQGLWRRRWSSLLSPTADEFPGVKTEFQPTKERLPPPPPKHWLKLAGKGGGGRENRDKQVVPWWIVHPQNDHVTFLPTWYIHPTFRLLWLFTTATFCLCNILLLRHFVCVMFYNCNILSLSLLTTMTFGLCNVLQLLKFISVKLYYCDIYTQSGQIVCPP
jgi:hypothetical protein